MLAKIEKPQAVERLAAIIEQADALMVARGDLGVEMPLERVPGIQKQITRAARRAGKPVVVATQMLESMITAPTPTRAEVSDVATAVFEGADAIMLSAESASGAYPVEAVATMDRIAAEVERDPNYVKILRAQRTDPEATGADAISAAARQIAETLNLAAICCYTASGTTAMRAARERPQTPIIALSPIDATARRLSLVWGLHCVVGEEPRPRRHGRARLRRRPRRLRQARRAHHHHRRRAARHARGDQHAAHRAVNCGGSVSRPSGGRSDILAVVFLLSSSTLLDVVEIRVDVKRLLERVERPLVVPSPHDHAEAGERAEMARLERQRPLDVGERLVVVVEQEIDGGPLVPALGEIRLHRGDAVEKVERQGVVLLRPSPSSPSPSTGRRCRCRRRATGEEWIIPQFSATSSLGWADWSVAKSSSSLSALGLFLGGRGVGGLRRAATDAGRRDSPAVAAAAPNDARRAARSIAGGLAWLKR